MFRSLEVTLAVKRAEESSSLGIVCCLIRATLDHSDVALGGSICEGMQLLVNYWRSVVREASGNRVTRQDGYVFDP